MFFLPRMALVFPKLITTVRVTLVIVKPFMGRILFLLVAIPLIETWFLIQVGQEIGALPTILAVIATAVIGGYMVRQQGLSTLQEVQQAQLRGEMPAQSMIEGMMIVVAGALLLTPGFFTDAFGFLLLLPGSRKAMANYLLRAGVIKAANMQAQQQAQQRAQQRTEQQAHQQSHQSSQQSAYGQSHYQPPRPQDDSVIEGEFRRDD